MIKDTYKGQQEIMRNAERTDKITKGRKYRVRLDRVTHSWDQVMGTILIQGGQLNQCYWFINQMNSSNSFHTSTLRQLLVAPLFHWHWSLTSSCLRHVYRGTAALSGNPIISLSHFQKSLFRIAYYNTLCHSLGSTFLIPTTPLPRVAHWMKYKGFFSYCQQNYVFTPLSEEQGSLSKP